VANCTTEPVTVYYGSSSGLSTGSTTTLSHGSTSVFYGAKLVGGDVNGDGLVDADEIAALLQKHIQVAAFNRLFIKIIIGLCFMVRNNTQNEDEM
jgi:hypothetical protein